MPGRPRTSKYRWFPNDEVRYDRDRAEELVDEALRSHGFLHDDADESQNGAAVKKALYDIFVTQHQFKDEDDMLRHQSRAAFKRDLAPEMLPDCPLFEESNEFSVEEIKARDRLYTWAWGAASVNSQTSLLNMALHEPDGFVAIEFKLSPGRGPAEPGRFVTKDPGLIWDYSVKGHHMLKYQRAVDAFNLSVGEVGFRRPELALEFAERIAAALPGIHGRLTNANPKAMRSSSPKTIGRGNGDSEKSES